MKHLTLRSFFLPPLLISLFTFAPLFSPKQSRTFENSQAAVNNFAPTQAQTTSVERCRNLKTAPAMFGLTITDISQASKAKRVLNSLATENETVPVVVRIVFDPIRQENREIFEYELNIYKEQVADLRKDTNICLMGTIADSYNMYSYLPEVSNSSWPDGYGNYEKWTRRLVEKMGALIDIWEVGNEVNGEWYGWKKNKYKKGDESDDKQDRKMRVKRETMRNRIKHELSQAFKAVHEVRPEALRAITLLYNADQEKNHCTEFSEYKMNEWADEYLTPEVRSNVDFVLLSYYENPQVCAEVTRDADKLWDVLVSLRRQFTGEETVFAFGEISYTATCYQGKEEISDEKRINNPTCQAGQRNYVERYYQTLDKQLSAVVKTKTLPPDVKAIKFAGGYFYWYFLQDMVLSGNDEAQKVLNALRTARSTFRKEQRD
jgi:hypothetical protein